MSSTLAWSLAPPSRIADGSLADAVSAKERAGKMQRWSKDKITSEIQRLSQSGEDLNVRAVQKKYPKLFQASWRHFPNTPDKSSWHLAIEAAGLDYNTIRKDVNLYDYPWRPCR